MKKNILVILMALLAVASVNAQGRRGLRINEVMVVNDSNVVDEYGSRTAWIELFNSTFAPLQISSVYLTNDPAEPKKYPVPLGDVKTKIPKRQHVVFFADNNPTRGTFHTSFALEPGKDNWIGIYDADGLTIIDSIVIPAALPAGASYARKADGEGGIGNPDAWEIRANQSDADYITPGSANRIKAENSKIETFKTQDKNGFALTVMAMGIVFSALLLLCICFYIISKIGARKLRQNKAKAQGVEAGETAAAAQHTDADTSEVIAAISMALYQHLNAHDTENTILTINKVKRAYSPWSSKIYSIRETPRR